MHLLVNCNSPNVADIDLTLCRFITLTLRRLTYIASLRILITSYDPIMDFHASALICIIALKHGTV